MLAVQQPGLGKYRNIANEKVPLAGVANEGQTTEKLKHKLEGKA